MFDTPLIAVGPEPSDEWNAMVFPLIGAESVIRVGFPTAKLKIALSRPSLAPSGAVAKMQARLEVAVRSPAAHPQIAMRKQVPRR